MAETVDIVSPGFHADPFPTLARMRATGPLVPMKLPILGRIWLTTTHAGSAELLKDGERFVRDPGNAGSRTQERVLKVLPATLGLLAKNMLGLDDPDHRRLRSLVDQAFGRRGVTTMTPMIEGIADRLLDQLDGKPEAELMQSYCRDLPLSVICAMLGLPEKDHDWFKGWLGNLTDTANIWAVLRAVPGVWRMVNYLRAVSRPGGGARPDGLITALREARTEHGDLSEDELVAMIFLLFGAGQETTTHLIAGGIWALLAHPEQKERLSDDVARMPGAVEECLRWVCPVQMTKPRFARVDMEWQGRRLRRGDMVAAFLSAANADPGKFEEPEHFDIGRHPNPHLSFGTGAHFCLGYQLARAEARIALERLFARFPEVSLAVPQQGIAWRKRVGIRALAQLPVRLRS
ncbi:MAG: cytochrome P450 [Mesorhizobium sp.]|nr:cytochrome P450 [Mesorhizobium sp.]MCO5163082.1 cytochrome P450 [Mesorhizobium sp.]